MQRHAPTRPHITLTPAHEACLAGPHHSRPRGRLRAHRDHVPHRHRPVHRLALMDRFLAEGVDGLLRDATRPPGKKPVPEAAVRAGGDAPGSADGVQEGYEPVGVVLRLSPGGSGVVDGVQGPAWHPTADRHRWECGHLHDSRRNQRGLRRGTPGFFLQTHRIIRLEPTTSWSTAAKQAGVHSRIRLHSHSASVPNGWTVSLPVGVDVSICLRADP